MKRPPRWAYLALLPIFGFMVLTAPARADRVEGTGPLAKQATLFSAVFDGKHIFTFGGAGSRYYAAQDTITRYDPADGSSVVMSARLPQPVACSAAVLVGQSAYVFGGYTSLVGFPVGSNLIIRYDIATDDAYVVDSLPIPLACPTAIWDGSNVYLFGGSLSRIIWRYSPSTGAITPAGSLPEALWSVSSVWTGTHAYLFGGRTSGLPVPSKTILRYDPVIEAVIKLDIELPKPYADGGAIWAGSAAYVFGREIWRFEPQSQTLATMRAVLPDWAQSQTTAVWDGSRAHVLAGWPMGNATLYPNTVLHYTPQVDFLSFDGNLLPFNGWWRAISTERGVLLSYWCPYDDWWCRDFQANGSLRILKPDWELELLDSSFPVGRSALAMTRTGASALLFVAAERAQNGTIEIYILDVISDTLSKKNTVLVGDTIYPVFTAAWDGQFAYLFGLKRVVRYDPSADTHVLMNSSVIGSDALWDGAHVYLNGITTFGGRDVRRFDPRSDTVESLGPIFAPNSAMVWTGKEIVAFGGSESGGPADSITRFDPASGTVSKMAAQLPWPWVSGSAVWTGTSTLLLGGQYQYGTENCGEYRYSPCPAMSYERHILRYRPVPSSPLDFSASPSISVDGNSVAVTLTWKPPSANTYLGHLTGYEIHRIAGAGEELLVKLGSGATAFVDSNCPIFPRCRYRIRALGAHGPGEMSPRTDLLTPQAKVP